jgi:SAM-dependent methyltransferase
MNSIIKNVAKKILPQIIKNQIRKVLNVKYALTPIAKRECNICGFSGYFGGFGRPMRLDARCPSCGALERHRLLMLAISRGEIKAFANDNSSVLHFAPEEILEARFRNQFKYYTTADFYADADLVLNLEEINVEDEQYDIIVANHVLEHVDDKKAAYELSRILKKGGVLVCQVPIVEGWNTTYENDAIETEDGRWLHFGQNDHVRFYGADFRKRICAGGFKLIKEVTSEGSDVIQYGLLRGEKVFVFEKS